MRKIILLVVLFLGLTSLSAQIKFDEAIACFNRGDYVCAIKKYGEAKKVVVDVNKIKAVSMGLTKAINCNKWLQNANIAFSNRKYQEAKDLYAIVLETNPNDPYAKSQLNKCNSSTGSSSNQATVSAPTTLLSKSSLSFTALGGTENVSITTNSSSYTINLLPDWCTVQIYANYFTITCNSNTLSTTRNDYFTVIAGDKSVRVYVSQAAGVESTNTPITLSVSKETIYFKKEGGSSESIKVISNAANYSISFLPSWCTIKTHDGYFVLSCKENYNSENRSDWFYVNAGDKQVKVDVNQNGTTATNKYVKYKKSNPTNLYLGIGTLKPMVFKADGKTQTNSDFGYSFMIGFVKTLGLYAKVSTNFSSISGDYTLTSLPDIYYGATNTYSNTCFNRFGVVGGLMLKLNPIMLYVGAGKGHYYHFVKTDLYKYLDDSFVNTVNLTTMSFSGLETDAGLIINFNKVGLSMGVSSFSFKYYEVNAGLGIRF